MIDDAELKNIQSSAAPVKDQVAAGEYRAAFDSWAQTLYLALNYSNDIDLYNFLVFNAPHGVSSDKRTLLANGEYCTPYGDIRPIQDSRLGFCLETAPVRPTVHGVSQWRR